jgi:hypothetical protein
MSVSDSDDPAPPVMSPTRRRGRAARIVPVDEGSEEEPADQPDVDDDDEDEDGVEDEDAEGEEEEEEEEEDVDLEDDEGVSCSSLCIFWPHVVTRLLMLKMLKSLLLLLTRSLLALHECH